MQRLDALQARRGVPQNQPMQIPKQEQEWSWNNSVSKPDGSYELPVAPDTLYNVMVLDTTGKWVAAAIERIQGQKNRTVIVPALVLTQGGLVTGTVKDGSGKPVAGVSVCSYGLHRPASSAACLAAKTDAAGRYRLRVAPGLSRVYLGAGSGNASQEVEVADGEIKTVEFAAP